MLKKSHYIILVLVVLLVVVLLSLPARTADRLKLAISGLFLPLIGLAASAHEATAKTGDALTSRQELLREKADLLNSNQWLNLQLQQAADRAPRERDPSRNAQFPAAKTGLEPPPGAGHRARSGNLVAECVD